MREKKFKDKVSSPSVSSNYRLYHKKIKPSINLDLGQT